MLSPNDMKNLDISVSKLNQISNAIDASLKQNHDDYPWEEAIIEGEYSNELMNTVLQAYYDVGWTYIYWRKSSENGERAGLTGIKFSTTPINDKYIINDHKFVPAE